jgi:hypothetical protein
VNGILGADEALTGRVRVFEVEYVERVPSGQISTYEVMMTVV